MVSSCTAMRTAWSSSSFSSLVKPISISIILASFTLLLLISHPLFPPPTTTSTPRFLLESAPPVNASSCSSVYDAPPAQRCAFARRHCGDGILNYTALHFCALSARPSRSIPLLVLALLLHFRILAAAAASHFSPAVSLLADRLRLSPSMAAVTLLALGNGAPDAFSSAAALRSGRSRLGLAAILSAGAFVSAFVVGAVAIRAAPFALDPAPFVRDVFFYLVAASALFYVYLSAEIYLWQAVGFVLFYVFFIGFVFWMDAIGVGANRGRPATGQVERSSADAKEEKDRLLDRKSCDLESGETVKPVEEENETKSASHGLCRLLVKVMQILEFPISTLLKLSIPSTSGWSRFYSSANIGLCPIILLFSLSSYVALDTEIVFLLPHRRFPLWAVVLFISLSVAVAHYVLEKAPPENEKITATIVAFMMSVFWISTVAGELMNCLATIGIIMELSPAILGLTVLAWGNSVGDLFADVALANAGKPAMAMAGCFAGPMFNMLVGLGMAMVIETASVYPGAYELRFNSNIVVAFVFLLLSLMGSLLVVTWSRFRVPRFWGFCLVGLYILFTAVSIAISLFS